MENSSAVSQSQVDELVQAFDQLQELLGRYAPATAVGAADLKVAQKRCDYAVSRIQVQPLKAMIPPLELSAAETGRLLQKKAQVECKGFEFEVPANVRDALHTLWVHAVRNSVDHGLEAPHLGILKAQLWLNQGRLHVEWKDNGRGADLTRIRTRAEAQGLALIAGQDDAALLDLIFQSGFSTRDEVTTWSGRGIGLDAVRSAFENLAGKISAIQQPNTGLVLRGEIPLSIVGLEVVPFRRGDVWYWAQATQIQVIQKSASPRSTLKWVCQIDSNDSQNVIELQVDQVGTPEYQLLRQLDPVWSVTGPEWLQQWMTVNLNHVLAAKVGSQVGRPMGYLIDSYCLQKFTAES